MTDLFFLSLKKQNPEQAGPSEQIHPRSSTPFPATINPILPDEDGLLWEEHFPKRRARSQVSQSNYRVFHQGGVPDTSVRKLPLPEKWNPMADGPIFLGIWGRTGYQQQRYNRYYAAPTAAPEVTVAAGIPRVISQTPASIATIAHVASQANPRVAGVNSGTYPPHGRPGQKHSPVQTGLSYGGSNPAQSQQYPPAANTTTTSPAAYHQNPQDLVTSLANDYGRQSISEPSLIPGSGAPVGGRIAGDSPPPLHPTHPTAAVNGHIMPPDQLIPCILRVLIQTTHRLGPHHSHDLHRSHGLHRHSHDLHLNLVTISHVLSHIRGIPIIKVI